jgi:hypothetical protein
MEGYPDPVLSEVRQIKAGIMREYGSLEAWHERLDEERPKPNCVYQDFSTSPPVGAVQIRDANHSVQPI